MTRGWTGKAEAVRRARAAGWALGVGAAMAGLGVAGPISAQSQGANGNIDGYALSEDALSGGALGVAPIQTWSAPRDSSDNAGSAGRPAGAAASLKPVAPAPTPRPGAAARTPVAPPAGSEDWRAARVSFTASGHGVGDLVRDLAANAGVRAAVDESLTAPVTVRASNRRLDDLLTELSTRHSFDWYHDGRVLHVTPSAMSLARLLRLNSVSAADLETALRRLGLFEPRYPIQATGEGLAYVVGPPAYIAALELVLSDMETSREPVESSGSVRTVKWGRQGSERVAQ